MKRELTDILRGGLEQMKTVLARHADLNGQIPSAQQQTVRAQIKQIVSNLFTGAGDQPFAPDGITALAPYPRMLNRWLAWVTYQAVRQHETWLRKHSPDDVFQRLRLGQRKAIISEQINLFDAHPQAQLDPDRRWVAPHRWTDERGYRLSDRIWRSDLETRRKIDELLAKGLADGRSAIELSQALEAYLLPGRAGFRTLKPYGRRYGAGGASADALRLSRTELSHAFNAAALVAGQMNPYVEGIDVARSANGDASCPICPEHATIGINGERLRDPYDKNEADISPFHPHCMCYVLQVVVANPDEVTAQLREMLDDSLIELDINPADAWAFVEMLLGSELLQLLIEMGVLADVVGSSG